MMMNDEDGAHHIILYVSIAPYPARNAQQKTTSAVEEEDDDEEWALVVEEAVVPEEKRRRSMWSMMMRDFLKVFFPKEGVSLTSSLGFFLFLFFFTGFGVFEKEKKKAQ